MATFTEEINDKVLKLDGPSNVTLHEWGKQARKPRYDWSERALQKQIAHWYWQNNGFPDNLSLDMATCWEYYLYVSESSTSRKIVYMQISIFEKTYL